MEPGVPFALLGAVQLLAIAAGIGLAAAALLRRTAPSFVVALGGLTLAAVEVDTALRLGDTTSDALALARIAGSLLLAVGLLTGGLGAARVPTSLYGVVVPLAAGTGPATLAGASSLLAAAAALRSRRDTVGVSLALGLALWGGAAFVSFQADSGGGAPVTVLILRGAGALALLIALGFLGQVSLLSKVVGAILAGVLTMAVAAVGVVGNVVVDSYDTQSRQTVREATAARQVSILGQKEAVTQYADLFTQFCSAANGARVCPQLLATLAPVNVHDFLVQVPAGGSPKPVSDRSSGLTSSAVLGLRDVPVVKAVLAAGCTPGMSVKDCTAAGADKKQDASPSVVRLAGAKPLLAVVAVSGVKDPVHPRDKPKSVYVYGQVLDATYVKNAIDVGGYGLYFLTGDPLQVVASSRSAREARLILSIAGRERIASGIPAPGVTVGSEGNSPTIAFAGLRDASGIVIGYVAVSRDAEQALKAQSDALRLLVITALLALLGVAIAAAILGRRTVDPVRRLTAAAERIADGDLDVKTDVTTRDEVGTLARTFETMTGSLGRLTGDLRDSAARLETVLASMSDGLLATDADGVVTSVNRAALEMLGLDAQDVLGEALAVVADVRDAAGMQLADVTLRLRDEPAEVQCPDGTTVPVRVAIAPLQGVEGVVMVLRDTTREREVERMKTEFLSNVSHELRTPLTPIRGYAEILVSKPGLAPEQVTTFATTIRDESIKMNRVVDLLVDVAALEAGRVSVFPRSVSAKELLDGRIDVWLKRAPGRGKDLRRRVAAGLPLLHVDPSWVGKALDELIDNAVKYTKPGTSITLVAAMSPDHRRIRVSVKDAGPGIDEADQAGLFTSFEQVDGSATRHVGGLGLGLSFVRRLAEDAGFPLTVASKLGKGAEFSLDLPLSDEPPPRRTRKK
jgi:two-component system sensor histidine kinase VicK